MRVKFIHRFLNHGWYCSEHLYFYFTYIKIDKMIWLKKKAYFGWSLWNCFELFCIICQCKEANLFLIGMLQKLEIERKYLNIISILTKTDNLWSIYWRALANTSKYIYALWLHWSASDARSSLLERLM